MSNKTDLKECPFCGDDDAEVAPTSVPKIRGGFKVAVFCNACFCEGPTAENRDEAISAWNHRARTQPTTTR